MKKTTGFTKFWTLGLILVTVAVGFGATRILTSISKAAPAPKNGGLDNAMEQARQLAAQLRTVDWDQCQVDQELLRLPEQDYAQFKQQRSPDRQSFSIPRSWPEYDEVALYSDTFVKWVPRNGKSGDSTWEGYFIVAWMDGSVGTVNVADVRHFPVPGKDGAWFYVFPGMDEYDTALKYLPGTREDLAAKKKSGVGS